MKKLKVIPAFKNEDEEREFWSENSPLDYMDSFEAVNLDLSDLKPTTRPITIRLPESLLSDIKILANKRDVPYQSLMKIMLAEAIQAQRGYGKRG